jgi:transcriptional regulator with XRE-family HTH domain
MLTRGIMRVANDNGQHEERRQTTLAVSPVLCTVMTAKRQRSPLGEMLFGLRSRKRFTLRELGDAAGVSGAYIGQIENATPTKPLVPSLKILRMIADGLGEGDQQEADAAYLRLGHLAGYFPESMLKIQAEREMGQSYDPSEADMVAKELREGWDDLPKAERDFILGLVELRRQYRERTEREDPTDED